MKRKTILLTLAFLATAFCHAATTLQTLRVEYETTPLGIDVKQPRFSWQATSTERGVMQAAYQISVKDNNGIEVWNSGKTASSTALNIRYNGRALLPMTRYSWTITVWDNKGGIASNTSWFETGLMTTTDKDAAWGGAKWIGGDDTNALTFYSQYLPVFRLKYAITLDKKTKSTQAGFIYGANDLRLMNKDRNILGVANGKDQSYIKFVLNATPLLKGDSATIDIYRVGYTLSDRSDKPFASFKIPTSLINKQNQYQKHSFEIASMHGTTQLFIDGAEKPVIDDFNLNPMGKGGDYISFPNVGDLGFSVDKGQKATFSEVEVINFRLPRHTLVSIPDETLSNNQKIFTPQETGAPMLRTEFATNGKQIVSARIYATARGIYELFLNGKRVGNDYLNPGLTQYNKTHFYQTYDVTSLLQSGNNALGAQLSEGWWSGALSFSGANWNFFGDKQSLLAQLVITYTDGSRQTIATNPQTWKFYNDGTVRLGSIFQGEVFDATKGMAIEGWTKANFDDSKWTAAKEVPLEGTISHETLQGFFAWPCPDDYSRFTLTAQVGMPVRQFTTLTAKGVEEVRPGVFIYDMGQNMAGIPRITFTGLKPGQKVYMRYAEVKYPDLPEYKDNVGMVMMENQRGAMEQDIYIAKGGTELFEPRHTYHGYQYIEITGIDRAIDPAQVKGIVLSSVDKLTASYETNNPTLNRFFKNVEWSSLANIFSIPTDCPQRNERMGWSGDLSVFSPTMSYMFNGAEFLRRHLQALRDTQEPNGDYPAVAPVGGGFGGPLWSSVGITMPWQSYLQYGDTDAISEHYSSMQKFIDNQLNNYIDKQEGFYNFNNGIGLGDWLGFEVGKNDNTLIFDSYLSYELNLMAKMAKALGKEADANRYARLRDERAAFIRNHYIDANTGKTTGSGLGKEVQGPFGMVSGPKRKGVLIDTQTSYAVPLAFGIVDKQNQKFVDNFLNTVSRQSIGDDGKSYPSYSLMTGFIGTAWISNALTKVGRSDYAYRMLLNKQFPSWLYPVEQGATTIWERLNSYTKDNGFGGNNSMNSFNHYAFGSVTNWLIQHSLGIARDENTPAFKHFVLCPEADPTGNLTSAQGAYDSMYGRIESSWQREGNTVTYRFTIPANTSATVCLPCGKGTKITEGGKDIKKAKSIKLLSIVDGKQQMEVGSGTYVFTVQ